MRFCGRTVLNRKNVARSGAPGSDALKEDRMKSERRGRSDSTSR